MQSRLFQDVLMHKSPLLTTRYLYILYKTIQQNHHYIYIFWKGSPNVKNGIFYCILFLGFLDNFLRFKAKKTYVFKPHTFIKKCFYGV